MEPLTALTGALVGYSGAGIARRSIEGIRKAKEGEWKRAKEIVEDIGLRLRTAGLYAIVGAGIGQMVGAPEQGALLGMALSTAALEEGVANHHRIYALGAFLGALTVGDGRWVIEGLANIGKALAGSLLYPTLLGGIALHVFLNWKEAGKRQTEAELRMMEAFLNGAAAFGSIGIAVLAAFSGWEGVVKGSLAAYPLLLSALYMGGRWRKLREGKEPTPQQRQ